MKTGNAIFGHTKYDTDSVDVCICSSDVYLASFCSQQTGTFSP